MDSVKVAKVGVEIYCSGKMHENNSKQNHIEKDIVININ